ncbi:MAG: hypothetical protein EA339_13405 [Rhodobacteraceae bacterium]|nr:MAG: hypothetical protein EA339_13405 [Paracoccaceae bacterium]
MNTNNPEPRNNPGMPDEAQRKHLITPAMLRTMLEQDFRNKAQSRSECADIFSANKANEDAAQILVKMAQTASLIPDALCQELIGLLRADNAYYLAQLHGAIRRIGFDKFAPEFDLATEFLEHFLSEMPAPEDRARQVEFLTMVKAGCELEVHQ